MPVVKHGGFVDIRLLTLTINEPITLHYISRPSSGTGENFYFLLREIDYKIIRSNDGSSRSDLRSQAAIKILINSVCRDAHVWTTSEELKALKAINLLTLRAPRAALISAPTLIRLLRHFECDIKALALEAVLLSLQASSRFQHKVLMGLKAAVMVANKKFDLPSDNATSKKLLENLINQHGLPYGPPWSHFYGEPSQTPALDLHSCLLLSHIITHPRENSTQMAWDSLAAPPSSDSSNNDMGLDPSNDHHFHPTNPIDPLSIELDTTSLFGSPTLSSSMSTTHLYPYSSSSLISSLNPGPTNMILNDPISAAPSASLPVVPPIVWRERLLDVSDYTHHPKPSSEKISSTTPTPSAPTTTSTTSTVSTAPTTPFDSDVPALPQPTVQSDLHQLPPATEPSKLLVKSVFAHRADSTHLYIAYSTLPVNGPENHPAVSCSAPSTNPPPLSRNASNRDPSESSTLPQIPTISKEHWDLATNISFADSTQDRLSFDQTRTIESNSHNSVVVSLHKSNNISSHLEEGGTPTQLDFPLQIDAYDQVIKVSIDHPLACRHHDHSNDVVIGPAELHPTFLNLQNNDQYHQYSSKIDNKTLSPRSDRAHHGTSTLSFPFRPLNFSFLPILFLPPLPLQVRFNFVFREYPSHMLVNSRRYLAEGQGGTDFQTNIDSTPSARSPQQARSTLPQLSSYLTGDPMNATRVQSVLREISHDPGKDAVPFMWEEIKAMLTSAGANTPSNDPNGPSAEVTRSNKTKTKRGRKSRQQLHLETAGAEQGGNSEVNTAYSAARFTQLAMSKMAAIMPSVPSQPICSTCSIKCPSNPPITPQTPFAPHEQPQLADECRCQCHTDGPDAGGDVYETLPTLLHADSTSTENLNDNAEISGQIVSNEPPNPTATSTTAEILRHLTYHFNTSPSFSLTSLTPSNSALSPNPTSPNPTSLNPTSTSNSTSNDLAMIHEHYYREFGHFAKLPPRSIIGQGPLLSQPGIVPFHLLTVLAISYFHERSAATCLHKHFESSDYACEVATSSFAWLLSQLHTPVTYSSTLIEYDVELSKSFFPNNTPPDLLIVPDLASLDNDEVPIDQALGSPPSIPSVQQDSWFHPSHRSSQAHGVISQLFRKCYATCPEKLDHDRLINDHVLHDLTPRYGITSEISDVLYSTSFKTDSKPPNTSLANDNVDAVTPPSTLTPQDTDQSWDLFQRKAASLFPYDITLETLPLWRALLFHIENLAPVQTFRLWRHSGSTINLQMEGQSDSMTDSASAESMGPDTCASFATDTTSYDQIDDSSGTKRSLQAYDGEIKETRNHRATKKQMQMEHQSTANSLVQLDSAAPSDHSPTNHPPHNELDESRQTRSLTKHNTNADVIAAFYADKPLHYPQQQQEEQQQDNLAHHDYYDGHNHHPPLDNQGDRFLQQHQHPQYQPISQHQAPSYPTSQGNPTSSFQPQATSDLHLSLFSNQNQSSTTSPAQTTASLSASSTPFYDNSTNNDFSFEHLFPNDLQLSYDGIHHSELSLFHLTGGTSPQHNRTSTFSPTFATSPLFGHSSSFFPFSSLSGSSTKGHNRVEDTHGPRTGLRMSADAGAGVTGTGASVMTPPLLALNDPNFSRDLFDHTMHEKPFFLLATAETASVPTDHSGLNNIDSNNFTHNNTTNNNETTPLLTFSTPITTTSSLFPSSPTSPL